MLINLRSDYNLRGYTLQYAARILLRREEKNNFIFLTWRFDDIDEILEKFRLKQGVCASQIAFLRKNRLKSDIIAFSLNEGRAISSITLYDVKSKNHEVRRDYFESCASDHAFMQAAIDNGIKVFIISLIVFEDWRMSFNIIPYTHCRFRIYSRHRPAQNVKSH